MKNKLVIIIVIILVAGGLYFYFSNRSSAEQTALAWSGIYELPSWASDKKIQTEGGMFTREFIFSFKGNTRHELETWVKNQSVFSNIQPEKLDENTYKYILQAKEGAQYAEVKIDFSTNTVIIRTYWS